MLKHQQKIDSPKTSALRWYLVGLIGIGICAVIGIGAGIGYLLLRQDKPINHPPIVEGTEKPRNKETPRTDVDGPKNDGKTEKKTPSREALTATFLDRLNRSRKSAGLGAVTLDAESSRACQAHVQYLAKQVGPDKSAEGEHAIQNALFALAEPLDALNQWMGSLLPRAALLSPTTRRIGIGFEQTKAGWICVVDPVRGSDEPVVIVPAPRQIDVPLSFTSGSELPDERAIAGYPISVTFPPGQRVADAKLQLRDAKGRVIDGWLWTPERPVRKGPVNTIAFVPKGLLQGRTEYRAKASAKVDGKGWSLEWSFTTADDADSDGAWAKKVLAMVNAYRTRAELDQVTLDKKLSGPCQAHARYLVINEGHPALQGLGAHDEDLTLPGATKEGAAAGKASDIAIGDYEPIDGVESWMGTLYHRVPILDPNLKTIGFGCARGRRQGWAVVMNVSSRPVKSALSQPVFYPAAEQTAVPVSFPNGGEEPNPIPESKTSRAGYPITVTFPKDAPLKKASGKLIDDKGNEIACWFSSPERPANPLFTSHQGNTACLIAKAPLAAHTRYHVHFQGQVAGKVWEKRWTFSTGAAGPSAAAAGRQVLDRLNGYRAEVGLNAVAFDDTLSRGCQLHADYLASNADVLLKKNAPVNDEDPLLPGFTRDGLRSAQHSLVFTNAPRPVIQIDDLMASFTGRAFLLDPRLQRVGIGCAHDIGRGWRCVLDTTTGLGESSVLVYPVANQNNLPTVGYDRLDDANRKLGFPISVIFPGQPKLGRVQAALTDANDKAIDIHISSPSKPLDGKQQPGIVGVHPLAPLQPGHLYTVTVSVIVEGVEWRQTWQFTTKKRMKDEG